MSELAVSVVPGYTMAEGEVCTNAKLNQLATPTVSVVGTISTVSIADGSVTAPKLAANAVETVAIKDANVLTAKIADAAVTTVKIADNNVTTPKILDGAVTTAKILDANVTVAKLAGGFRPITGSSRNLVVFRTLAAPNNKLTATADELILTGAGVCYLASTVNITADVTASGLNGLDTGAEANSTWYYLFVIYDGTTVSALFSTSKTAPTMPAGYTHKALVGAVFNGSGGDFAHVITYGNVTKFVSARQACTQATGVTIAHNLGTTPTTMQWVLVCTGAEINWSVGDEVTCAGVDAVGGTATGFTESKTSTNVYIIPSSIALDMKNKTTGAEPGSLAYTGSTLTNWQMICYATLV